MGTLTQIGADIIAFIIQGIQNVTTFVSDIIAQFTTWFTDLLGQIPSIQQIFNIGLEMVQRIIDGIFEQVGGEHPIKIAIQGVIEGAADAVKNAVLKAGSLLNIGLEIVTRIAQGIKDFGKKICNALAEVINDAIYRFIGRRPFSCGSPMRESGAGGNGRTRAFNYIGQTISAGIAQGIYDGSHWVAQAAVWTVHNAMRAAQYAAGVHSPSALFAGLGHDLMAGLQAGIAAQIPAINAQVSAAVTAPALGMVQAPVLSSGATVTNNFHLGGNNISNDIDGAIFEARVVNVIRRNMSGAGGGLF
jgi:hypothetical protein